MVENVAGMENIDIYQMMEKISCSMDPVIFLYLLELAEVM